MGEQHHSGMTVVLLCGHFMGVSGWVARAGITPAAAAAQNPGSRSEDGSVQTAASTLAHKAVEGRVGHAVQAGQQQ